MNRGRNTRGTAAALANVKNQFISGGVLTDFTGTPPVAAAIQQQPQPQPAQPTQLPVSSAVSKLITHNQHYFFSISNTLFAILLVLNNTFFAFDLM